MRSMIEARQRRIGIGPAKIAIPFGYFIFENKLVAEQVPGQFVDRPVVLMGIAMVMGKHDIRLATSALRDKPFLDGPAFSRKIAVREGKRT